MLNDKWTCRNCDWHGIESEITKYKYFEETQLEPEEWLWHCPVCNVTSALEEDSTAWCSWCDDEPVSDEGEVCSECRTTYAEAIADEAKGH